MEGEDKKRIEELRERRKLERAKEFESAKAERREFERAKAWYIAHLDTDEDKEIIKENAKNMKKINNDFMKMFNVYSSLKNNKDESVTKSKNEKTIIS